MIPNNRLQHIGQLTTDEAAQAYAKSGTLIIVGGIIGLYLVYKLLIQR